MGSGQIDTLRGFACLLLVAYHVIGADPSQGLRVDDGLVRWVNDALAYLRMPLFTFLSGFVYGLRPFAGDSRAFLLGKVRRLLIPMLVVGTLFAIVQALTPGAHSQVDAWYLLHVRPVAHFWFVESLFWVFLLIWALERWRLLRRVEGFMLVLALACLLYLTVRGWVWFGIEGAVYLLPYFLVGLACARFSAKAGLASSWVRSGLIVVAVVAVVSMGVPVPNPDRRSMAMLLAGVSLCLLCLGSGVSARWLSSIGRHSYAIYLFHVFFTAAVRIGAHRMGLSSLPLDIILGLSCGVLGPIVVDRIASRSPWPALLLLGKSRKSRVSVPPPAERASMVR